jgi:hypothetical protein
MLTLLLTSTALAASGREQTGCLMALVRHAPAGHEDPGSKT